MFRKEVYLEIQQERAAELAGAGAEVDAALRELGGGGGGGGGAGEKPPGA